MGDHVDIEISLFEFHADEAQHHKEKLRFLVSFMFSVAAALLVLQRKEFFDASKLEWPILVAAGILLTGLYYALVHHCIKLLTKCTERDHHETVLRKLRAAALKVVQPSIAPSTLLRFNISPWSALVGIAVVGSLAWLALLVFCHRIKEVSGAPPPNLTYQDLLAWKHNIENAQSVVLVVKLLWLLITGLGIVELFFRFRQYLDVHRKLKTEIGTT